MAKKIYGFDTYNGLLSEYVNRFANKYDIVTAWDVIEHVPDYMLFLQNMYDVLKPNGCAIIKTPNINCPERIIFGPYYHSFKREHLTYFSNNGLIECANKVGFKHFYSTSNSHLLKGFVGEIVTDCWGKLLQGSDLIVYLKK